MPLTVDSVVHGPGAKLPARAMMLALSEELFNHLRDAVNTQRSHPTTTNGNHPPPPPVELEFTRSQSLTEKSPGLLYIGGQPLRLTGIPERIFDLYAQPHVPNDTPNTNPLRLHAIVSQSLKVPLSLTENLTERLHNRTASEQKEKLKRGLVRIDSPVVQANPKKRKVSPSAQQTATIPPAVPKRAPPRPSQPSVQTLAGPPLSAETLARQAAARSNASASDSSSSSSQPLAQQAPPRLNGTHTTIQPPISRSASYSSDKVTPPVSSQVNPAPSSSTPVLPPISTPLSGSARTVSEGWKTSNFRGGVKTKDPPKSATTKAASGASASGSTKARTVKSKPIIIDDLDELSPPPPPPPTTTTTTSASSSRAAAVPRDVSSAKNGSGRGRGVSSTPVVKAGTKRARESSTSVTYDASAADSDLLAAVDVANSKRGTARAVEAELIAAVAAVTTNGKKTVSAKSAFTTAAKKARVSNIDDELLDAAAAPSKPSGLGATAGKGKTRVAKAKYDDEDWDAREERKQLKKSSARASTGSTSTAPIAQHPTTTSVNGKVKKAAVISETAVRASPPVRANGNPVATVGKKRPLTQSSAVTSTSNGNVNGSTTNRVSSTSQAQTNGSAKSVTTNGVSATAAKRSGHARKRTSPIYTDSEEETPSKPIPNVPKTKPRPKHATASSGAAPPSPVSTTTTSTSKPNHNNTSSSRASGGAPGGGAAVESTPVPIKKRPRLVAEAEDKKTDALMARPLPRSRSALREHYDACYATYIELWARIIKERRRQQRLLQKANGNGTGGGSDNEEYSSSADSVGENVKALTDRYSKLHQRLQTIRATLGVQQQVV